MKKQYILPEIIVREVIISNIMSSSGTTEELSFGGEVNQFECRRVTKW